ncbi:MAG: DUF2802 domain-containing protein [Rhodocyclaceae bacterium]|nr:DUF2802 domain-containing protein [Rhodocyclaceae bacterium]
MGARTLIWTLVGLLAIYVAVQLLRIGRQTRSSRSEQGGAAPARIAQTIDDENGGDPAPELAMADADAGDDAFERLAPELRLLRQEVGQLRAELEAQRDDSDRLNDRVGRLEQALAGVHAAQQVSPQYREAVMLARQGLESEAIAERCSISVAEAALVRSLAQRGEDEGARDDA